MLKSENIRIPLIVGGVLILGSFAPVIQIILLHGNGAFLYPFGAILTENLTLLNYINLFMGLFFLYPFYLSKKVGFKILWAILAIFFLHGFIMFKAWDFTGGEDISPYYLGFMISAFLATLPLLLVGYLKEKNASK